MRHNIFKAKKILFQHIHKYSYLTRKEGNRGVAQWWVVPLGGGSIKLNYTLLFRRYASHIKISYLFTILCTQWIKITCTGISANQPPVLKDDMNNLVLSEDTPVGSIVHQLQGEDPEGSPVHYGIVGTDRLHVDRDSGKVTLIKPLDREVIHKHLHTL